MANRTGTMGNGGIWNGESKSIGITMETYEYPIMMTVSGAGVWTKTASARDGAGIAWYLGDHLIESFTFSGSGQQRLDKNGTYILGSREELCGKELTMRFSRSASGVYFYGTCTIEITTLYRTFTVTVNAATGGTVTATAAAQSPGGLVGLTVTPSAGYQLSGWATSPTIVISHAEGQYYFTMPGEAVTITPSFTRISYAITKLVSPSGAGTITAPTADTALHGTSVTFRQQAATGYTFSHWLIGSNRQELPSFTITMDGEVTVTAVYTRNRYAITSTVSPAGAGAITAPGSAGYNDTVSVSQVPATGYQFSGWTLSNGGAVTNGSFTMPNGAVTLTATYTKINYAITAATSPSGAGTITAPGTATYGDEVTISQEANEGYYFTGWTLSGGGTINNGKFTMPAEAVTVTANYLRRSTATINKNTLESGGEATISIYSEDAAYTHAYRIYFMDGMDTGWVDVEARISSVTVDIPMEWANEIPNSQTKEGGTLSIRTYSGETLIGTYETGELKYHVSKIAAPTIGDIETSVLRTVDGITYANIGDIYTQGHCGVKVKVGKCTAKYGATIAKITIQIGGYSGTKYRKTVRDDTAEFESGLLTAKGERYVIINVTDSRDHIVTVNKAIQVQEYTAPIITALNCWRTDEEGNADNVGEYAQYSYAYTWTKIGNNEAHVTLSTQGGTAEDCASSGWLLPEDKKYFSVLDTYPVTLTVKDKFETTQLSITLGSGRFIMHFDRDGERVAFGHAVEKTPGEGYSGTFEIDKEMEVWIGEMTLKEYIQAVIEGTV